MIDITEEKVEFLTKGYNFTKAMEREIANDPNHDLSLESAVKFIKFYGFEVVHSQGLMGFVGRAAVARINKALVWEGYDLVKT